MLAKMESAAAAEIAVWLTVLDGCVSLAAVAHTGVAGWNGCFTAAMTTLSLVAVTMAGTSALFGAFAPQAEVGTTEAGAGGGTGVKLGIVLVD